MGIDNFNTWLIKNYGQAIVDTNNITIYDYIYIDINHLLHNSIYEAKSEHSFKNRLKFYLDKIFNRFVCTKTIVLAVDGSSPYSKLMTQRKRRIQMLKTIDDTDIEDIEDDDSGSNSESFMSSMQLTPGTTFMNNLHNYLTDYSKLLKERYNHIDVNIVIVPPNLPGEGEIKIFKLLQDYNKINCYQTNLVVGNDADLIVIAMATKLTVNIDVMIHLQADNYIISTKRLCEQYSIKVHNDKLAYFDKNIRSDFCIVSIMNGNDYLPKLYYGNFNNLWLSYVDIKCVMKSTLIIDDKINVPFLKAMMLRLNGSLSKQFKVFRLNKFDPDMVKKYLEGLVWCLYMYTYGVCPDQSYIYTYNKGVSPMEVYYYLELYGIADIQLVTTDIEPLSTNACAVLLLPKKMKSLLPDNLRKLVDTKFSEIGLYEEEECVLCNDIKLEKNSLVATDPEYRKKLGKVNNKLTTHRDTHEYLSFDKINKIVKIVDTL